jgi:hypothetical protein
MRLHLRLVLATVLFAATGVGAEPREPNVDDTHSVGIATNMRVAVHVYSQVEDFGADDERISLEVAKDVFSTALVDVGWTVCAPGMCVTPSAEALKLRIVQSPDRGELNSGVLGHALIDSQAHAGVLATVFIDRTRRLAGDLGIDYRIVLGRAIAHELGHLLLGTSVHGTGLMREVWSHDELLGARRGDWQLDPLDASAIRDRLARRGIGRSRGAS